MVKHLEESSLSVNSVSKIIGNEAEVQKELFLSLLLDSLVASFLVGILSGKDVIQAGETSIIPGQDS